MKTIIKNIGKLLLGITIGHLTGLVISVLALPVIMAMLLTNQTTEQTLLHAFLSVYSVLSIIGMVIGAFIALGHMVEGSDSNDTDLYGY